VATAGLSSPRSSRREEEEEEEEEEGSGRCEPRLRLLPHGGRACCPTSMALTDATFECKEIGSTLELVSMDCWQVILLPDCSC
jgi:hypothetical protein